MKSAIGKHSFPVGISMSKEVLSSIDSNRGDIPRSKYVTRMLEQMLKTTKDHKDLLRRNGIDTPSDQANPAVHKEECSL